MTNEEQKLREIAEKWGFSQDKTDEGFLIDNDRTKECLSDLTALISEGYVSKELVNQEVEKRIAERMPSEEEIETQAIIKMQRDTKDGRIGILIDGTYADVFIDASEWLRSRLTNDNQKKECDYYASKGKCLPGCMTDSCIHHPNNR